MLSVGNTVGSSGASLSLDARVAIGAGVFAVSAAETSTRVVETPVVANPTPVVTATDPKIPAYNAFEFAYRSDFGKIILLQQNVDTGQEVTQVPTEYHLRQYAATQREQRVQLQQKLYRGSTAEPQAQKTTQTVVVAKAAAPASGPAAPAASQPAAPSVAPSAAAAAHVDIKA